MMTRSPATQKRALPRWLKVTLQWGVIGGLIAVAIALQGMFVAFSSRAIVGGIISTGVALLLLTFFVTGYVAIRSCGSTDFKHVFAVGALAGLLASAVLVALVLVGHAIDLGNMMINATEGLYDLLTFGLGRAAGSGALLLIGLVSGLVAALFYSAPYRVRRTILVGLAAVFGFGLLRDLIVTTFSALTVVTRFLYLTNGLSIVGAITVFVIAVAIDYAWSRRGTSLRTTIRTRPQVRRGFVVAGFIILLLLPQIGGLYMSEVLDNVGLYLMMGLGLNIVVGFAGLLDLGYVAFFAIGAYTVGILTSPELSTGIIHNWWIALPFAVLAAVFAGVALGIPVLRMRGDYLAIVTLGFGEIIRYLALSDWLKPYTGGAQGIQGILKPDIGNVLKINWGPEAFYYLFLAGTVLIIFIATRLRDSRLGRSWMAVREDEDVAQAMGINLVATKLLAFALGASFGGLSGAIFASKLGSVYPTSFSFLVSIYVLSLIIIGGMGSIPGVVVGAIFLVGIPELMREVGDFRYLFFGLALVAVMLIRPEGLWPSAARKRELHEEEPEAEELSKPAAPLGEPAAAKPD
jgi:branched-chain amino acid transport system permease protein